jgi:hypothetical protein
MMGNDLNRFKIDADEFMKRLTEANPNLDGVLAELLSAQAEFVEEYVKAVDQVVGMNMPPDARMIAEYVVISQIQMGQVIMWLSKKLEANRMRPGGGDVFESGAEKGDVFSSGMDKLPYNPFNGNPI